jgi:negative regulator of flagellin synthesis FlgM
MKILHEEAVNAARIGQVTGAKDVQQNQNALPVQGTATIAGAVTPAATVSFSAQAQEIAKATAAVAAAPEIRTNLVNSLKARIDKGEYNVSGADIADMMMRRQSADSSLNG